MSKQLPLRLPPDQQAQQWKSILDPVTANPLLAGRMLQAVALANGTTIINHGLGRPLIGWFIVGSNAAATVYDNQANNQTPALTLSLTSNAAVTVNLWVF